ncbi:MAG: bi-domain-containing oxidoreductase [Chitinophagaceae bacterium]|nr:bi-domain-containing oxidoreductase [Chitinophagaceae bacterium]
MKQLIQNFKTGDLYVDDVPIPSISSGMVLVQNHFSLISAGTEKGTVKVGKASLIGKARQRPDLVAQVFQNIKKEGLVATFNKVKTKLDSLKALGYSSSGIVLASLDKSGLIRPGDRVACAGQDYASHAGVVSVPQNLVAKIPDNVSFEEAAFTTLGAIAMQGVRQANPKLGEKVCVIGLGLLGQLTIQLLNANGCDVFGVDFSEQLIKLATGSGCRVALNRNDPNLSKACENFTKGIGFDSVIITAAAPDNDPVILATEICRKRGKIIIVGAVKMDVPREPHFYKKELELKISCSYGPGRYDSNYEELGNDYPVAYVRWTEQRNMDAFLDLISRKKVNVNPLITHVFDIAKATEAYDIVLGKTLVPHIGILLEYKERENKLSSSVIIKNNPVAKINVGFIGAGSFAQSYLIPNLKPAGVSLDTVVTTKGITSKNVADKFGFNKCSTDKNDVFSNKEINTVFVATTHSSHASLVKDGLLAHKNIYVEKPLALTEEELDEIIETKSKNNFPLMVGFNRRFAPVCVEIKRAFENISEPLVVNIRVNAGFIPKDHWTQIDEIGGGRIIGEVCHFIDLMQFFTGSDPVKVYADCISSENSSLKLEDNLAVVITFKNGSVGNLTYVANGDKSVPKELIEVFGGGKTGIVNNFKNGTIHSENKIKTLKSESKGHREEVAAFLYALARGEDAPIDFRSICLTTLTTFKIVDSLQTGLPQDIL